MKVVTKSAEETKIAAKAWLKNGPKEKAVALIGDLGAGKTTFVQGVAQALGVKENITSPTFVLQKIYRLTGQKWQNLIHFDCYRLEKSAELLSLGWEEIVNKPENLILVEWADKFPELFKSALPTGGQAEKIYFNHGQNEQREISFA